MKPSIAGVLETIRNEMTSDLNMDVFVGAPDGSARCIYLYPFHFQEAPSLRSRPTRSASATQSRDLLIKCLLIANPAGDLEILSHGMDFLYDNPMIELENETIRIMVSNADTEELAQIFLASDIVYRLAIGFVVQFRCK